MEEVISMDFVLKTTKRFAPFPEYVIRYYVAIVPDHAAGRPHRYSVYRIPSSPSVSQTGGAEIIGRELPLKLAKKIARQQVKASNYNPNATCNSDICRINQWID